MSTDGTETPRLEIHNIPPPAEEPAESPSAFTQPDTAEEAATSFRSRPASVTPFSHTPDFLLDVQIGSEFVYPLAAALKERRTPFIFLTGHDDLDCPTQFLESPRVSKPFRVDGLLLAIQRQLALKEGPGGRAAGIAHPQPQG